MVGREGVVLAVEVRERAERRLVRLLKSRQAPLQAYLSAAQAASRLGISERTLYRKLKRYNLGDVR